MLINIYIDYISGFIFDMFKSMSLLTLFADTHYLLSLK